MSNEFFELAILDPYNPQGSTTHVNFTTSRRNRWETAANRCHVNWAICDSDWEAEFCRVVEAHPKVAAYVKNAGLGFEVPYRHGGDMRRYLPDFLLLVDDGHGPDDPLHLEYWIPGVNSLKSFGRWAFAEFRDAWEMGTDLEKKIAETLAAALHGAG